MVSLWFSYGFPMVFLWFPYGFPMVSLWFPCGFPMVSLWFSYGFPMVSLRFSYGFPAVFLCFPGFSMVFPLDFLSPGLPTELPVARSPGITPQPGDLKIFGLFRASKRKGPVEIFCFLFEIFLMIGRLQLLDITRFFSRFFPSVSTLRGFLPFGWWFFGRIQDFCFLFNLSLLPRTSWRASIVKILCFTECCWSWMEYCSVNSSFLLIRVLFCLPLDCRISIHEMPKVAIEKKKS